MKHSIFGFLLLFSVGVSAQTFIAPNEPQSKPIVNIVIEEDEPLPVKPRTKAPTIIGMDTKPKVDATRALIETTGPRLKTLVGPESNVFTIVERIEPLSVKVNDSVASLPTLPEWAANKPTFNFSFEIPAHWMNNASSYALWFFALMISVVLGFWAYVKYDYFYGDPALRDPWFKAV